MPPPGPWMRRARLGVVAALAVCAATQMTSPAGAAPSALPRLRLRRVADLPGLTAFATRAANDAFYVASQDGVIRAVRHGTVLDEPVLDISGETVANGEQGLLGLAFSPDGAKLYVDYTTVRSDTRVDEFTMRGDVADPATRRTVLAVDQPQVNHNGGQLAFGPDGDLYIGLGDGGSQGDQGPGHAPGGNGQSLATLLGKILRIDPTPSGDAEYTVPPDNPFVGVDGARPEIWAYGLRNPWRFSFDTGTGDLWIGDVGQDAIEEVDFAAATAGRNAGKGLNFGWNRLEGDEPFRGRAPDDAVGPVIQHTHADGWLSVIGGYVYHGPVKALRGTYVYSDYYKAQLVGLQRDGGAFVPVDLGIESHQVSAFGQGRDGSLFVLSQTDGLLKLVRA
ncbi:MAG: PQQ-dependent sugar dehydrogenase [Acidimicrobiia bacterium]